MNKFQNNMSNYNILARVYPVVISLLPLIAVGVLYSLQLNSYSPVLTSIGISGALLFLLAQLGRDRGKSKERYLWKSWGGAPTTQVLRFANDRIDVFTKRRYHAALKRACPIDIDITEEFEKSNFEVADQVYQSWTKYMINFTRDVEKFQLVFKENINYGFRRNIWGLKPFALSLIFILLIANTLFFYFKYGISKISLLPTEFFILTVILLVDLLFWIFIVKQSWVKIAAFAYAERLFEQTDKILT